MTSRLLTGPRRYAQAEATVPCASIPDSKPTFSHQNSNSSTGSVPFANPSSNSVITPIPSTYTAATTPFSHNTQSQNPFTGNPNSTMPPQNYPNLTSTQIRRKSSKAKGIDIDSIPRPDINAETSYAPVQFNTSELSNPPPSYTSYVTVDDGNAGPRYIRSSFYKVPTEESLMNSLHMPFGFVIQPFADPVLGEEAPPLVDYGQAGPLRCPKCRTYINPNWIFIQGGNTFICNLCKSHNPVPKELYCPLDAHGNRADRYERPELCKGVCEFLVPESYHTKKLVTPNIIICVEASTSCYMSGIFHQIMSSIQSLLDFIPSPELTRVCIVTYDSGINYFRVPDDLSKDLSIIHVPEVDAGSLPLPQKALFLNLHEDREKLNFLIEKIVKHYESNNRLQKGVAATCFGTTLVDCCDLLADEGGRVMMFGTHAPTTGLGKIKRRDDYKLMGGDKERSLYVPQVEEYGEWAKNWLSKRISIDLFCFSPEYFDLATIGQICNTTGGNIYYYPTYNGTYDGEKLHYDLSRNLTRTIAYDTIMTLRTSKGLAFLDYVLPNGRRPIPEVQFATLDADSVINAYFRHEEKLKDETVSVQIALLYTNAYAQRVIRVINFKLGTSNELATIFKSCDAETVAQLIIKKNILNISNSSVPKIRKELTDNLVAIFHSYKVRCANSTPPTQLVFPDQLKVLPVFFLATLKSHILRAVGDTKPDDRSFDLHRFLKMPLNVLSNLWYVKIYPVHTIFDDNEYGPGNVVEERTILGPNLPATDEKIDNYGMYLLDNNDMILLYVKRSADPTLIHELFGVESFQEVAAMTSFQENTESYYGMRLSNIIDQLRKNKNASYQPVRIVTEKDAYEPALMNLLVEDERLGDSYNNFLCHIHKQIQDKL